MYPRRLGTWRWEAALSLRSVNTERAETQRHGGFQELACTHLCNIPPGFIVLDKARRCTKREGRACRVRLRNADAAHAQVWQRPMWLRRPEYRATPQSVFAKVQGRNRRTRPFGQYDNPIIFHTLQWMKQRVSQPQNQSPCPRASARSVLTGRRPRDVPAPPRRVALGGGPEPQAGQHGARGDTEEIRNGRDALVASDGGGGGADGVRTLPHVHQKPSGRDKRGPPVCLTCMTIRSFPVPFPSDHFQSLSSG